ncbi:EamA family transporter RarD [Aurantimonas sp. 22II-16-19i]|uniref:EamA family transporter RarD n=1 Tax=Aurantimonas sp. 22II-16-19i TaxID=1317114 RepID=UPI0009F7C741|nr:EamA family transporter RarD [Aurantimonas sp. 22II-16-19i]ORE89668.1 RarD protein, DMT superfamily transporter [Aurantimonas sp. 22II-16-19i]
MQSRPGESRQGLFYALGAYGIWGFILPIFMKQLANVSPVEVVAHRIVWALPLAAAILLWQGTFRQAMGHFRSLRTMALAALTASLISVNWGTYIYAIGAGQTLDAALGYYINPLVNVALAAIFLGERPTRLQGVAITLATIGVAVMTVKAGGLPWVSLVLAMSFGTYGLLRKMVPVGASEGFFLEVAILVVPSLLVVAIFVPQTHFLGEGFETMLLIAAGPLTAVPLILYAAGARLLHYATIGILQYIVPTLLFFTAVFLFGEPFSHWQLIAFAFIWTALAIYTWSLVKGRRRQAGDVIEDAEAADAQAADGAGR